MIQTKEMIKALKAWKLSLLIAIAFGAAFIIGCAFFLVLPGFKGGSQTLAAGHPGSAVAARAAGSGSMDSSFASGLESADPATTKEDRGLYYSCYVVKKGDTASEIAEAWNVTLDTVISFNNIQAARSLQPGQVLKIPNMAGILYTAKAGDTAQAVADANKIPVNRILEVNPLASQALEEGRTYFLPDARLASFKLREIAGDLFAWPARGWITSFFGWRDDPFGGTRTFHNGLDIGMDMDTPIGAAMNGVVADIGYSPISGNYILIAHHAGWSTFYCHLDRVFVKVGQAVATGTRIALSGNTGYTTGPHLHFSVFKNGASVNPYNVLH